MKCEYCRSNFVPDKYHPENCGECGARPNNSQSKVSDSNLWTWRSLAKNCIDDPLSLCDSPKWWSWVEFFS